MGRFIRFVFFGLVVRFVVLIIIGLRVRNWELLPGKGPAILVANHNSHLDTMVLMSLFPLRKLHLLRPVAAADYFLRNRLIGWFSQEVIGIIPIDRRGQQGADNIFDGCIEALNRGQILIIYPEGSRGEPEQMEEFKWGITKLVQQVPETPVTPILLHGLGKSLPKGEGLLVPFFCDVLIGQALHWGGSRQDFMQSLRDRFEQLRQQGKFSNW